MQTVLTFEVVASLLLAILLGGIVGFEREAIHKPAGLRTHMLVCLGACLFTVVSLGFSMDPARVAAGIVAGIGFIGAGTIWADKDKVQGVTTAASLWATAAIGLAVGVGDFLLAALVTALVFAVLSSRYLFKKLGVEENP
ncbi:MAG: MgtC/SapB family protein [Candidatus Bathyarchaeota archaeon]|nr:MgtC/SapB family protein [Candidatus Bathyarchaeota archaeon]